MRSVVRALISCPTSKLLDQSSDSQDWIQTTVLYRYFLGFSCLKEKIHRICGGNKIEIAQGKIENIIIILG